MPFLFALLLVLAVRGGFRLIRRAYRRFELYLSLLMLVLLVLTSVFA